MKLSQPFFKLPVRFDPARLSHEVASLPPDAWVPHPQGIAGNSAVRLITVNGEENDSLYGVMAATRHLELLPYVRQVLASFGVVWSRSRLMRLAPGATVPEHADINYHWFTRVRVHIPIVTHPAVRFLCGDETVHMSAGEAWIFDNWRLHSVVNGSEHERIHLVADTTGTSNFWRMATLPDPHEHRTIGYVQDQAATPLTEYNPQRMIMWPVEVDFLLDDLADELIVDPSQRIPDDALARYKQLLADFRLDWRQLYSRHAEDPEATAEYLNLRESLRDRSAVLGVGLVLRTNRIAAHDVLMDRVLRQLLRLSDSSPTSAGPRQKSARRRKASDQFYRPIFIVAAPRSGSTLLYETLAVNRTFCNLGGEAHWLAESIPSLRPGAPGVDSNRLTAENCTDKIAEQVAESVLRRASYASGELVGLSDLGIRLLEKTPKNSVRIPFFTSVFPDARFIYLWRDPRENLSSIMEAWRGGRWVTYKELPGWDGPWSLLLPPGWRTLRGQSLESVAAYQWTCTNQLILDDLGKLGPERWTTVSYSDLVSNPKATIERLCSFAGVDFDDRSLARVSAPLPLSRYTNTPPQPGKWRRNESSVLRVLPSTQPVWDRLQKLGEARTAPFPV